MTTCPKPDDLLDRLREWELFEKVDDEALCWLIDKSSYHCLEADEYFFRNGDPVDHMQVILTGSYVIRREDEGRKKELGFWEAPYVAGVLPFSRMTNVSADAVTSTPTTILQLHRDCFVEMVNRSYELTQALVSIMTNRVRDFQQARLMDEKLMALGKMSAGLAHELNNPASAMVRSGQELHRHLKQTPERFKELVTMRVDPQQVDQVNAVLFDQMQERKKTDDDLSLIEREELSDGLLDWFEERDIEEADDVIDTFVDWGFRPEHLERIAAALPPESVRPVLWWIETNLTTESLVDEIGIASTRIAELVKSIKSYSHMDSEPSMEFIDVHEGLISTLTMLKFKFKKRGVKLTKEWDRNLPHIKALAGELNQVYTNLIVNALDAMDEQDDAQLTIRTYLRRNNVCVDFEDNGPGVPEALQSRVFEPFFTTKGIGEGTGMGLDIVRRVLDHHGGNITLESEPGRTLFRICFPT